MGAFNTHYGALSAWGQFKVDNLYAQQNKIETTYNEGLPNDEDPATLIRKIEHLNGQLEQAKMENNDLWEENTNLKMELTEIQESLHHPPST